LGGAEKTIHSRFIALHYVLLNPDPQSPRPHSEMKVRQMLNKTRLYWAISGLLLTWVVVMAVVSVQRSRCAADGQEFTISEWSCVSRGPGIILQRDLQRG
jgi:hypothetical protein